MTAVEWFTQNYKGAETDTRALIVAAFEAGRDDALTECAASLERCLEFFGKHENKAHLYGLLMAGQIVAEIQRASTKGGET